ncbi:uncharacterized protein PHACADRAFT_255247 [Phanerochaete carnosa HHB-10118-sp]|uniref:Protein kinase domain-containing protein n=1 Tax=Phanerochaete carnosa (strain HHB-10118-sp) TaxID=650164 RepID=K5W7N5_PHACS|nr:uncharacterized protein PHACADRAFT_255247 [Phanerochaete carnosa HHB-10118-sp]EKM54984.1 hypothetical protein PHACADRAFT_255247 [Phanerochaete carnosa HHB-10118-sp]
MALESDDRSVLRMLQQAVYAEKEEIMGLREDNATSFLTLVDSILYPSGPGQDLGFSQLLTPALDPGVRTFKDQLQRASVRLSMASFRLPEGLYLTGVSLMDSEHIATGAYADVRMGRYRERRVALKTMRVFSRQTPDELSKSRKTFCREISLLHSLDHQNICGLIGVDRELFGGRFCLVTEWMPHGNIIDFIEANSFVLGEVKQFVIEIALALEYLHSKNVVHGDLHVRNILIDAGRHVRLADFGLSDFSDASSASVSSASAGAVRYMAPEILHPEKYGLEHVRHTPESDIHSFAMCVWTIFDGNVPFHDYSPVRATLAIIEGKRPLQHTTMHYLPVPLWSLLCLCWQEQPRDRPSSPDLYLRLRRMFQPPASAPLRPRSRTKGFSGRRSGPASRLREDDSGNESTASSRYENDDGGLSPRSTLRRSRGVQSARCTPVTKSKLMNTPIPSPVERPRTSPAVIQNSTPPTVRNLASVYTGVERLVPQIIYRPPQAQQLAGTNASPIMFNVLGPRGCGISCLDALNEQFAELQDSDDIIECQRCVVLRIMWPDYEPWSVPILLHSTTTRAELAMRVSSYTQTFLDESLAKCLRPDTRWRLGPGAITLSDLELVGLQPVAVRDWQVHFRVRQTAPLTT